MTARLGWWDRYDEVLATIHEVQRITPTPDPDLAVHFAGAAKAARDAGFTDRARASAQLGLRHAEILGLAGLKAELQALIDGLEPA